jgi:outer membrane immunogenic protein
VTTLSMLQPHIAPDGLLGGFQAGYNWQMDSWCSVSRATSASPTGAEGQSFSTPTPATWRTVPRTVDDFAFGTVRTDVDFLASVRGRLGFAIDSLLIYGTGGVAWADAIGAGYLVGFHGRSRET